MKNQPCLKKLIDSLTSAGMVNFRRRWQNCLLGSGENLPQLRHRQAATLQYTTPMATRTKAMVQVGRRLVGFEMRPLVRARLALDNL